MKNYLAILSILLVVAVGFVAWNGVESLASKKGKEMSHTAVTELKWGKAPFGPDVSQVFGDFSKGEHVTYVKFTAGMKTPLHTHTSDYVGLVISGTSRHWVPGKPKTKKLLSAGSHWYIPAKAEHISECLPGVECVMVIIQNKKMDFIPTEKGK